MKASEKQMCLLGFGVAVCHLASVQSLQDSLAELDRARPSAVLMSLRLASHLLATECMICRYLVQLGMNFAEKERN